MQYAFHKSVHESFHFRSLFIVLFHFQVEFQVEFVDFQVVVFACQALAPSGESLLPAGTRFAGASAGDATGASRIPRRMLMPKELRAGSWELERDPGRMDLS